MGRVVQTAIQEASKRIRGGEDGEGSRCGTPKTDGDVGLGERRGLLRQTNKWTERPSTRFKISHKVLRLQQRTGKCV